MLFRQISQLVWLRYFIENWRGAWKGLGESLRWGLTGCWGTNVLHLTKRQKDSPGLGCNRFYTTGPWHMQWCHTAYAIYQGFSMTHLTSCPRQRPLVGSCQWLLTDPWQPNFGQLRAVTKARLALTTGAPVLPVHRGEGIPFHRDIYYSAAIGSLDSPSDPSLSIYKK